jgi:predicted phosphate transport protein (TIGR00153 family)
MVRIGKLVISLLPPSGDEFYRLFEAGTDLMVQAAELTWKLFETCDRVSERAAEIGALEEQADEITHMVMRQLHRSFLTPFDRGEVAGLAHTIDEVVDYLEDAAAHAALYQVSRRDPAAVHLAELVNLQALEIRAAVRLLRDPRAGRQILERTVEINRLENEADTVFRRAVAALMAGGTDVLDVLRWRDIYQGLESATDRAEDVANILEGIVLERA